MITIGPVLQDVEPRPPRPSRVTQRQRARRAAGTVYAKHRLAMNTIAFGTKRAFHSFLRATRKLLNGYGLTAARFDLLYAITHEGRIGKDDPPHALQSAIRRQLGVSAPVVSRMLAALERLGLVDRTIPNHWGDRRQRIVTLTERGIGVMRLARRMIRRAVERVAYAAICAHSQLVDAEKRFWVMRDVEAHLLKIRLSLADRATLYFPWGHPDE